MMGIKVADLQINPRITAAVLRAGLQTGEAVLKLSGAEIEQLTKLSSGDVTQLKDAVTQAVLQHCTVTTALQLWRSDPVLPRLSTGCELLDRALRGGLLTQGVTEVVGESASGKTQLCLQLCLTVQLPHKYGGLEAGAMYVCTEGAFPSKRLHQMSQCFAQQYRSITKRGFTDFILLEHVADLEGLELCLKKKVPVVLERGRVKLLVVDSIAALFRCTYDAGNMSGRAKHIATIAIQLRRLADQYGAVIVCVNQVTANMSRATGSGEPARTSVPALGLVWADHVSCRLLMSRSHDPLLAHRSSNTTLQRHENSDSLPNSNEQDQELCGQPPGADSSSGNCSHSINPTDVRSTNVNTLNFTGGSTNAGLTSRRQIEVVFAPHLPHTTVSLVISHAGVSSEGRDSERTLPTVHYRQRPQ